MREFATKILIILHLKTDEFKPPKGYAPLLKQLDYFWLRRIYQRIRDCFERPIASAPGAWFEILDRETKDENYTFQFTGSQTHCLNLASYNYLGFAENKGPIADSVAASIRKSGVACASSRMEGGNFEVIGELEEEIAKFVSKPAAIVIGMGYATNSTTLPAICGGKGTLILSDSLNHNSIVAGSRDSGAAIRVFKHNDPHDLEKVIRDAIVQGQPRTRRPWKKIIIIAEGIYSMEGQACKLPEIIRIKKKYKAYLYVDEAHSIGALGKTGRGVCEHWGVNPDDVDILMGTFTKAFGSVGGYVAGPKEFIEYLRHTSYGSVYSAAMSPPCAQQALDALRAVMYTDDGRKRVQRLHDNSNYFREKMLEMGFQVFGDHDSPVVPMMVYHATKMCTFSRALLARRIAVVIVGFPVTPLLLTRVRFCISAGHSREDMEFAIQQVSEVGDRLLLKYNRKNDCVIV
jgi:serine palmitoyltransferase